MQIKKINACNLKYIPSDKLKHIPNYIKQKDYQKTSEYNLKEVLCLLNNIYKKYDLITDHTGLQEKCSHGDQINNHDCGIFVIMSAEHISQKEMTYLKTCESRSNYN